MTRALLLCLALTACAATTAPSTCPPVIPYTAEQQAQARKELATLPPDAVLRQMLADYLTTRDRLRALP